VGEVSADGISGQTCTVVIQNGLLEKLLDQTVEADVVLCGVGLCFFDQVDRKMKSKVASADFHVRSVHI